MSVWHPQLSVCTSARENNPGFGISFGLALFSLEKTREWHKKRLALVLENFFEALARSTLWHTNAFSFSAPKSVKREVNSSTFVPLNLINRVYSA